MIIKNVSAQTPQSICDFINSSFKKSLFLDKRDRRIGVDACHAAYTASFTVLSESDTIIVFI